MDNKIYLNGIRIPMEDPKWVEEYQWFKDGPPAISLTRLISDKFIDVHELPPMIIIFSESANWVYYKLKDILIFPHGRFEFCADDPSVEIGPRLIGNGETEILPKFVYGVSYATWNEKYPVINMSLLEDRHEATSVTITLSSEVLEDKNRRFNFNHDATERIIKVRSFADYACE